MKGLTALAIAMLPVLAGCVERTRADIDPPVVPEGSALFVGAGDIALCGLGTAFGTDPHQQTAKLIDQYPPGTPVFVLGDTAYAEGDEAELGVCYEASWGRFKIRTYPVPGNHEYRSPHAGPYFAYFGPRAGDPKKGYYAFDVGKWHVLALNTSDGCKQEIACAEDSDMLKWVKAETAAHPSRCTLAMFHHPRFTSNRTAPNKALEHLYRILYRSGVDLVLTGHAHSYERFAPADPDGKPDPKGFRQFVIGTGGAELRNYFAKKGHSEKFQARKHGILELVLHPESYDFRFILVDGTVFDQGSGGCT